MGMRTKLTGIIEKDETVTTTPAGDSASALTVSQALAKMIRAYGAEYAFTLTGAPQNPHIDLQNHEGVQVILGRSERSVLAMADAYARVTGKPTFGLVQFGPGATYLPASIIDAFWASSPLVSISGTTNTSTRHRYEYQELEQTSMFPAITKWAGDLPQPERIADIMRTAVFKYPRKGTRIVHIDLDPNSLGRTYREELSIVADSRTALTMLRDAAVAAKVNGTKWAAWTKQVQGSVASWLEDLERVSCDPLFEGRLNPYHLMRLLNQHLGADDMVVADTGYMAAWAVTVLQQKQAGRNILRAAGSLGWAFPAAFGAKLAVGNKRRVFGLTGDGGIGYHIADLETALRIKTPVIQIVLNNASLAFEYHVQKYVHEEMCPEASEFLDVPFGDVARAFGAHGERVTSPEQFIPALRKAEESGKPAIIDVVVSREIPPPVTRYEAAGLRKV